jgi:hypothetical protein
MLLGINMAGVEAKENFSLKDRFGCAQNGDYVVIEYQKLYTFFHILEVATSHLLLEEISVPIHMIKEGHSWRKWYQSKAPRNVSWVTYNFNFQSGLIEEAYSLSEKRKIDISSFDAILPKLVNLRFQVVSNDKRLKSGPMPGVDEIDTRPLWNPGVRVDGRLIQNVEFDVWHAKWDLDESDLAGKEVELYMAKNNPLVPDYFPFWLQVKDKWKRAKLRVIDSGRNLYLN